MYYLYVKTHNITGLKYLGQTKQKNPHKYKGSGKYWTHHIQKHGYNVTTQILLYTENLQEIKETGVFFSKLWNIVASKEWANLKEESGDGGQLNSIQHSEIMKRSNKERVETGTHHFLNSEIQRKIQMTRLAEGRHHMAGENSLAKKRAAAGTHNWQGEKNPMHKLVAEGIHPFQNKEWSKEKARKQVEAGTNAFVGGFYCIGPNGETKKMTKEEYYAQSDPKKFVHPCSKEAKKRRRA